MILPLMSETEFGSMVQAWAKLVEDNIASVQTAREQIPGIDPFVEADHDVERQQEAERMLRLQGPPQAADDDDEDSNES